jgi:carotenoid cleavage dioxygenase
MDPETGKMYIFGYSAASPYCQYSVINADGKLTGTVNIDIPMPVMMHDFACSKKVY